jgi:hypothetical protein
MTTYLSFDEEMRYSDDPSGITIPVVLISGSNIIRLDAKVDTGAEICLFKYEHGEELGFVIEEGIPVKLNTLTGPLEAFGHEVTIQTGQLAFHSTAYFAKHPNLSRNILGRQGWLRNLRLAIVDYDNLLYLTVYDQ